MSYIKPAWLVGNVAYSDMDEFVEAIDALFSITENMIGYDTVTATTSASGVINLTTALDLPSGTPIIECTPITENANYYAIITSTETSTFAIVRKTDNTALASAEISLRVAWINIPSEDNG